MARLRGEIRYSLRDTPRGGQITIASKNREAVDAIHQFLRFQITDHQTGDDLAVR